MNEAFPFFLDWILSTISILCSIIFFIRNAPPELRAGCNWLVTNQLDDGGWGENFESCEAKEYIPADQSQTVNTAWALLALMAVR